MHPEPFEVPAETRGRGASARSRAGGRVVAVGTTTTRALETASPRRTASRAPSRARPTSYRLRAFAFRGLDALLTNFHLPRSSLLGFRSGPGRGFRPQSESISLYAEAIREGFRFYSYGDAMLIL